MAIELHYTSAPRGLAPGSSGFCTVAASRGFPAALISRLESLTGYRIPDGLAEAPPAFSHWIIDLQGVERHVLAAIRSSDPDHTRRSNKHAHFVVLKPEELADEGAAWMMMQNGTMADCWVGEPTLIESERSVPRSLGRGASACQTWERCAGDAGWAGVLAGNVLRDPSRPTAVIYPMGTPVLALIDEALSILPARSRWRVTFTTFFMQPVAGLRCSWRFCLEGSEAAHAAQRSAQVIDLCARHPLTRTGEVIEAAREGRVFVPHETEAAQFESQPMVSAPIELEPEHPNHHSDHGGGKAGPTGGASSLGARRDRDRDSEPQGIQSKRGFFIIVASLALILGLLAVYSFRQRDAGATVKPSANGVAVEGGEGNSSGASDEGTTSSLAEAKRETNRLEREVEVLNARLKSAESGLQAAQSAQSELAPMQGQVTQLQAQLAEAQSQVQRLTGETESARAALEAATKAQESTNGQGGDHQVIVRWESTPISLPRFANGQYQPGKAQRLAKGVSVKTSVADLRSLDVMVNGMRVMAFGEAIGSCSSDGTDLMWTWSLDQLTSGCIDKLKKGGVEGEAGWKALAGIIRFDVARGDGTAVSVRMGNMTECTLRHDSSETIQIGLPLANVVVSDGDLSPSITAAGNTHRSELKVDGDPAGSVSFILSEGGKFLKVEFQPPQADPAKAAKARIQVQRQVVHSMQSDIAILRAALILEQRANGAGGSGGSGSGAGGSSGGGGGGSGGAGGGNGGSNDVDTGSPLRQTLDAAVVGILEQRFKPSDLAEWQAQPNTRQAILGRLGGELEQEFKTASQELTTLEKRPVLPAVPQSELSPAARQALRGFDATVTTSNGVPLVRVRGSAQ